MTEIDFKLPYCFSLQIRLNLMDFTLNSFCNVCIIDILAKREPHSMLIWTKQVVRNTVAQDTSYIQNNIKLRSRKNKEKHSQTLLCPTESYNSTEYMFV